MRLFHWLRLARWLPRAQGIFKVIYGRSPSNHELPLLLAAASDLRSRNLDGAYRRIVNGSDHQLLPTAFVVRFSQQDVVYTPLGNLQLAVDQRDASVSQPLLHGSYEGHLMHFYQDRLKPGMTFIDVGANVGLYSVLAAQLVRPGGKVVCFEPKSENCRLILLSAAHNKLDNVVVYPIALSSAWGHALFTTHIGSNGGLIPNTMDTLLSPNCTVVPIARLEDVYTGRVDMIKMDVEGAEGLVVEGAKHLIEKGRPIVTSEFSLEMLPRVSRLSGMEYLQYFKSIGYDLYHIDRDTFELVDINDIDRFIGSYGPDIRIEDLAFIPR